MKEALFAFVDLEKAFDRIPREVIRWAMRKLGVEKWSVSAVMSMYTGVRTVVRKVYCNNNGFEVKFAISDCRASFIWRIQSCLTMGVVVCR